VETLNTTVIPQFNFFLGHLSLPGFCCEVDESCSKISKYITDMENCMTFTHDFLDIDVGKKYWTRGSMARRDYYRRMHNGTAKE
jgi:hypothetical protein